MSKAEQNTANSRQTILLAVIAAVLLVVANSAFWLNRYIFDANNFASQATASLTSESSRNAVAAVVTDKIYEDRPVIKNVLGNTTQKLVSGLLGTSQFSNALDSAVGRLHVALTSNNRESLVLNLEGIKTTATKIVTTLDDSATGENIDKVPDQITLIDASKLPNFYKFGVVFLWMAPVAMVGAVIALVYPYTKEREQYKKILFIQGVALTSASVLALLIGPLFRPPLLGNVADPNARVVVGNVYNAFMTSFNNQTMYLVVAGVLVLVVTGGLYLVPKLRK